MRPEITNNEAELRAEIEDLKRQLEQKHASASAAEHIVQPSRHTIRNLVLLLIVILIGAFVAGYLPRHRRELQLVAEADTHNSALPEVSVMTARRAAGRGNLVLPGNIQAVTEAPILARAEGFLKTRYVDIGDRVTPDSCLPKSKHPIWTSRLRRLSAAVEQVQADLERATAALEQGKANESLAKVTAQRWENLVKRGVVSRQENDQYQAQYQAQSANVRALDHAVAAAKSNIAGRASQRRAPFRLAKLPQSTGAFRGHNYLAQRGCGRVGELRQHLAVPHRADESAADLCKRSAIQRRPMCMSAKLLS